MVDKKRIKENWIKDYIPTFDISKIEWKVLNQTDFFKFLILNYYQDGEYITLPDLEEDYLIPLGLVYTTFNEYDDNSKYLISYIKNKKGSNTILTCLKYYENYKSCEVDENITFLNYVETNFFYKRMGLFNLTLKKFVEIANFNKYVLTTPESIEGSICHTVAHLKKALEKKDVLVFDNIYILKDDYVNKTKKLAK